MSARPPLLGICTLVTFVSLPLFLRRVGVNRAYGIRTPQTLLNSHNWYAANAFAGWAFILAALVSAGLLLFAPGASRLWISISYFVAPMSLALLVSLLYANHLS